MAILTDPVLDSPRQRRRLKKIRWCRQRDRHSCGPVAALNALKWAGVPATYKNMYRKLYKLCWTDEKGTFAQELDNVLRGLGSICNFKVTRLRNTDIQTVTEHIMHPNKAIILNYTHKHGGHFSFWPVTDGKWYLGINDMRDYTLMAYSRARFRYYLRPHHPEWRAWGYPVVWSLTRHE